MKGQFSLWLGIQSHPAALRDGRPGGLSHFVALSYLNLGLIPYERPVQLGAFYALKCKSIQAERVT
jgi:hypothetical protein